MKARPQKLAGKEAKRASRAPEGKPSPGLVGREEFDLLFLEDSLAKSPWERMQANDDALRFADTLRAAMEKRNAKS